MDPESRRQLEIIELRTAIDTLNKQLNLMAGLQGAHGALELRVKTLDEATDKIWCTVSDHESLIEDLRNRIRVLEEAQQRQIAFNQTVQVKPAVTIPSKKSFWSILK